VQVGRDRSSEVGRRFSDGEVAALERIAWWLSRDRLIRLEHLSGAALAAEPS
jgi:hypothetical protein